MPTYDFQCESRGKLLEARVSFGDAAITRMPGKSGGGGGCGCY